MNKRLLAAIVAAVLAIAGIAALVAYANNANDRAYDGAKLQTVYRVTNAIPAGTPSEDITAKVEKVELPKDAVADNAVRDLDVLDGLRTTITLAVGEQLLTSRFSTTGEPRSATEGAGTALPDGLQEITVPLSTARVVGGALTAGDVVGVIVTYDDSTNVLRSRVLVTTVQSSVLKAGSEQTNTGSGDNYLVTLAVSTPDAEKIVNAAEVGRIWLTRQNEKTDTSGARRIEPGDILK